MPIAILVVGLLGYFIWWDFLSPRASALGACDRSAGCLYTAFNGNRSVRIIGYSADGARFLSSGTKDGIIHDAATGKKVTDLDEGRENHSYVISGDRSEIIAYRSDSILFFDWEGELLRSWTPDPEVRVGAVALVPLVKGFVIDDGPGVSVWRLGEGTKITQLMESESVWKLTASADGEVVAVYNSVDDRVTILPLRSLAEGTTISDVEALDLVISADGSRVATGGPGGAYVWNSDDGSLVTAVEAADSKATTTTLSEDGTLLAVGFENGIVTVWDVNAEQIIRTIEHEHPASHMAFNPAGTTLAVGLDHKAELSGGDLVFQAEHNDRGSTVIRQSDNRVDVTPGYAIVWSLAENR